MNGWMWWMSMENRRFCLIWERCDQQRWPSQLEKKVCFHSGPHDYDYVYKVAQRLPFVVQEWRPFTSFFFLDLLFRFSFRWLFVTTCALRDWFSPPPPHYIDETPPRGSSGNSSCADNFELSYLVTVQTRVNAQICFRCLSLHGSISSCFCFQG